MDNTTGTSKSDLEKQVADLQAQLNGLSDLQRQIRKTASLIAADLELINSGETEGLKILSLEDSMLKKVMFAVKNKDLFTEVAVKQVEQHKDETPIAEIEKPVEIVAEVGNPFEIVSKKIKAKINGSK